MKSLKAGKEFKKHANAVLEDRAKSHLIVEILSGLDSQTPGVSLPALHALSKVLIGLIRRKDLAIGKLVSSEKDPSTPAEKYALWIGQVFEDSWSKILTLITSGDVEAAPAKRMRELSLNTSLQIVAAIQEVSREPEAEKNWCTESTKYFLDIVTTLCSPTTSNSEIIGRFAELYLLYTDVKHHTILGLSKLIKKLPNTSMFQSNVMKILEGVNFGEPKPEAATYLCGKNYSYDHQIARKAFSHLWEEYMKLGNKDFDTYKRILIMIHDKVMPHLLRPLLLTDFLMNSYNVGGSISLLALNGVFSLIQNHNLEYPEFYTKLYKLLTIDVLHVKYRARFFYLADLFLTSTHLPEYIVAAFVKRLSRLSLVGPANALLMIFAFIGNLLIRHKGLTEMITKTCAEEDDPYNFDEQDPAKSRAIESGLWEIRTLQSHILPQVAHAAKFINKPLPQMEWNLADFLEVTMSDMLQKETKKRIFVNVPLTFDRPDGFKFSNEDIMSQNFEFN